MSPRIRTACIATALVVAIALGAPSLRAQGAAKLKIGFSFEATKGERWQTDRDSFSARARQLGAEVISTDANGDDELQFRQVKQMLQSGISVLVLLPHDTAKAARMVDAAKAAHVKVISYDRLIPAAGVDLYVSFDRNDIGRMQAEYLVQHAPSGNYVLLAGSPNDDGAKTLHDAQMKVLHPFVDRGAIHIIADEYIQDWVPSEAYLRTLKVIFSSKGNIAAVLASNDGLAGGAIQALTEHHLAGKVPVSGQDADLTAIIGIAQGTQAMTVYKPVTLEGERAADEAVRLAHGQPPSTDSTVVVGSAKIPAILLKPVLVTADNIKSTVVKDGFQTLTRINQGLPKDQQIN